MVEVMHDHADKLEHAPVDLNEEDEASIDDVRIAQAQLATDQGQITSVDLSTLPLTTTVAEWAQIAMSPTMASTKLEGCDACVDVSTDAGYANISSRVSTASSDGIAPEEHPTFLNV